MRLMFSAFSLIGMLWNCSVGYAAELSLSSMRCFASPETPITAYTPAKEAAMSADAYHAPKTSPHLETLDVLSIGMSLDVFRQGQVWKAMQEQSAAQTEALHVGSILPMDPKKYPTSADDKDMAYEKRQADALELGLKNFLEKWPIPTVTVVRGWNPSTPNLRFSPERTKRSLSVKVNNLRIPAGLHWHRIANLQDGIICNDTPEGVLEALFHLFERRPDLPAVLVYANEGISMAWSLSSKDVSGKSLGGGSGPRVPGALTDTMVALIVGRPERVDWLRQYAPYTKVNKNKIDPEFRGWGWRKPPVEFRPTQFIPQPWTARALEQWDALPVLARLHRPVSVLLTHPDNGERLKREALTAQLAAGWKKATDPLTPAPARLFYDGGLNATPLAELTPALSAAHSSLDLLDSRESYDLTQRLGDTGAASPFVGIALATMASYLNGDSSVIMPLRRKDQATLIGITSPTPGKKPIHDPFGVNLMSQNASSDDPASPAAPVAEPASRLTTQVPPSEDYALGEFLSSLKPKIDWMDDL
ncbi:TPA: type VI lipase adapter Tla3 domain-containing protein [Pseudomonas aeruginosa]